MIQQGQDLDEEEEFFLDWGRETLKNSITRVDEMLARQLSIAVALAGGGLVALDKSVLPAALSPVVVSLLLFSALFAYSGVEPRRLPLNMDDAEQIRRHKEQTLLRKSNRLRWASVCLGLALVIGIVGISIRAFGCVS